MGAGLLSRQSFSYKGRCFGLDLVGFAQRLLFAAQKFFFTTPNLKSMGTFVLLGILFEVKIPRLYGPFLKGPLG